MVLIRNIQWLALVAIQSLWLCYFEQMLIPFFYINNTSRLLSNKSLRNAKRQKRLLSGGVRIQMEMYSVLTVTNV